MTDYETVKAALEHHRDFILDGCAFTSEEAECHAIYAANLAALDRLQGERDAATARANHLQDAVRSYNLVQDELMEEARAFRAESTRLRAALERFLHLRDRTWPTVDSFNVEFVAALDAAAAALAAHTDHSGGEVIEPDRADIIATFARQALAAHTDTQEGR